MERFLIGGGGEIRTHDAISDIAVFKTAALIRSATPPLSAERQIVDLGGIEPPSPHCPDRLWWTQRESNSRFHIANVVFYH